MQDPNQFLGSLLVALGLLGLLVGFVLLRFPGAVRTGLAAFPRSKSPAWILTAVCVFWVAWVVQHAALGRFEGLKPLIPLAAMALFGAVVWLLDELLAPRALGGLLLLVANPMLMGLRWADSAWRFVPVLIAYAWIIIGCSLMLHPWAFRQAIRRFTDSAGLLAVAGWGKLIGGAILLAAGLWQLR